MLGARGDVRNAPKTRNTRPRAAQTSGAVAELTTVTQTNAPNAFLIERTGKAGAEGKFDGRP